MCCQYPGISSNYDITAHMLPLLHKMALLWKHKYAGLARSLPFCKMSLILRQIGFWDYGDIFWKDPMPSISTLQLWCVVASVGAAGCSAGTRPPIITILALHGTARPPHKLSHYPGPSPILSQGTSSAGVLHRVRGPGYRITYSPHLC